MTRYELNRAVARATGDRRDIIASRGFSLVNDTAAIDDLDLEAVIADWDRIREEELRASGAWSLSSPSQPLRRRRKAVGNRSIEVVS